MNAYTENKSFLNSFIKVPSLEKQACIFTEIIASELSISLPNFEAAPCTKLVVYGYPQKSCDTPSDDVCYNSVCVNCYCPKCEVRTYFRGNRCECSCLHLSTTIPTTATTKYTTTYTTTYTTSTFECILIDPKRCNNFLI